MTAPHETKNRRYSLVLPEELFLEVQRAAEEQGTTVVDLIRKFIKLGLLVMDRQNEPGSDVIIRQGAEEYKVLLL